MNKALLLCLLLPVTLAARAECDKPVELVHPRFSAEQIALRYRDYLKLCELQGGTLVDGQRVHPQSQFMHPPWEGGIVGDIDSAILEKGKNVGPARALIGFVVDETGHVVAVSLIHSSGNATADEAAMQKIGGTVYAGGAQLDGKPVRAYFASLDYVDLRQIWHNIHP